jgi:transcription elongation factor S-II
MATMDAKQLHENGKQLAKAYEAGDPSSTILTLMAPLEKWTATEDLLRSSKIGVVVAKLRTSKDPKIASTASQLVNKWKAAVKKRPGSAAAASPAPAAKAANGVNGRSATNSPAPVKKDIAPKKYSVAPEKRNAKEDKVDTAVTGNQVRDGCITLIYNGLCFLSEESPDDILAVSQRVEAAAFKEYQPETSTTYKQKMRSLHLNLKMKQNTALRRDVFIGTITPPSFVTMTSDELKNEDKRKEDAALKKENMNKAMTAVEEKAISTTYVSPTHPWPLTKLQICFALERQKDPTLHPLSISSTSFVAVLEVEDGCGVFFAFSTFPRTMTEHDC